MNFSPRAIAYAGYPGAGKTLAAEYGAEWVGGEHISMGEAVKEIAYDELGEDATSHEIGHWATVSREINGPAVMAEYIAERWENHGLPPWPVHFEGVRSIEEIRVFQEVFGFIPILFIDAPFDARLDRLQDRGRDDEDDFGRLDLLERDSREAEWGLDGLDVMAQYRIKNDDTPETLRRRIGSRLITGFGLPEK